MSNKAGWRRAQKHLGKLEEISPNGIMELCWPLGIKTIYRIGEGKPTSELRQEIRSTVERTSTKKLNRFADKMDEFFETGDPTPKHPDATTWFMSLPEPEQDRLQQDPAQWAEAAFEAGREVEGK